MSSTLTSQAFSSLSHSSKGSQSESKRFLCSTITTSHGAIFLRSVHYRDSHRSNSCLIDQNQRSLPSTIQTILRSINLWTIRFHLRRSHQPQIHHIARQIKHPHNHWPRIANPKHHLSSHSPAQLRRQTNRNSHQNRNLLPHKSSQYIPPARLQPQQPQTQVRRKPNPKLHPRTMGLPIPHLQSLTHPHPSGPHPLHHPRQGKTSRAPITPRDTASRYSEILLPESVMRD